MSFVDRVCNAVDTHVFDMIGVSHTASRNPFCMADLNDKWFTLDTYELNGGMCGPARALFKSLRCTVRVGYADEQIHIEYDFSYEHFDGSTNGKTCRYQFGIPRE